MYMHPVSYETTHVTYVHVYKAHGQEWVWSLGVVNTKRHICGDPGPCHWFEAKSSHSLPQLTVWSYLQFAQMPTSWNLAIFVPMTMTMMTADGQTDYFTPCTCTRGKKCSRRFWSWNLCQVITVGCDQLIWYCICMCATITIALFSRFVYVSRYSIHSVCALAKYVC